MNFAILVMLSVIAAVLMFILRELQRKQSPTLVVQGAISKLAKEDMEELTRVFVEQLSLQMARSQDLVERLPAELRRGLEDVVDRIPQAKGHEVADRTKLAKRHCEDLGEMLGDDAEHLQRRCGDCGSEGHGER